MAPIKLSQNEIDHILANERAKWRNFRIQQVRAQANEESHRVCEEGRKEEKNQKKRIEKEINTKWEFDRQRKVEELKNKYKKGVQEIGLGHQRAQVENEALQAYEIRRKNDDKVAAKRGKNALLMLNKEKSMAKEKISAPKMTRERVMRKEKIRSTKISKLPTPVKFKSTKKATLKPPKKVIFHEAGTFTTSSYLPSKVKVIKEDKLDHFSGKESARRENAKYEEMEKLRKKEEDENKRKIEERGRIAIKKEKTKEMYTQLMKQLQEAEENNELSDYLKGDEHHDPLEIEALLREHEAAAEEKAKIALENELDTIPIKLESDLSKEESESSSEKSEKFLNVDAEASGIYSDVPVQDTVDNILSEIKSPLLQSKDIHFKETVPIHEIPIMKEKFLVRIPLSTKSSSTSPHSSETSKTTAESSKNESSFEELKITLKVNLSESSSEGSYSREEKTEIAESDVSTFHSHPPKKKINSVSKGKTQTEVTSSSSGVTDYYRAPPTILDSELNNKTIWQNIKDIQERGKKIDQMIKGIKRDTKRPLASTETKVELSSFKTPPQIYTETLKDGSGEKPISKRQKFEAKKKLILERYMRRLVEMKQKDLKEITASTVEGSGFSLNSSDSSKLSELLKRINISSSDLTFSTTPTITSDLLKKVDSADFIHQRPSTFNSTSISSSLDIMSNDHSLQSLMTPVISSQQSTPSEVESDMKKQAYLRLIRLKQLKQELIIKQKMILESQKTPVEERQECLTEKSLPYSEKISRVNGNSLDWSSNNYETPSREISTQSWSEFSAFSFEHQQQEKQQHDVIDNMPKLNQNRKTSKVAESNIESSSDLDMSKSQIHSDFFNTKQSTSLADTMKALRNLEQKLKGPLETDKTSGKEHTEVSSTPASQSGSSNTSSSTFPDMEQLFHRFGLGWAHIMNTKMDKAEEAQSSDYTE